MYECHNSCQLTCICMFTNDCNVQTSSAAITLYAAEMESIVETTNLESPNKNDSIRSAAANSI